MSVTVRVSSGLERGLRVRGRASFRVRASVRVGASFRLSTILCEGITGSE